MTIFSNQKNHSKDKKKLQTVEIGCQLISKKTKIEYFSESEIIETPLDDKIIFVNKDI